MQNVGSLNFHTSGIKQSTEQTCLRPHTLAVTRLPRRSVKRTLSVHTNLRVTLVVVTLHGASAAIFKKTQTRLRVGLQMASTAMRKVGAFFVHTNLSVYHGRVVMTRKDPSSRGASARALMRSRSKSIQTMSIPVFMLLALAVALRVGLQMATTLLACNRSGTLL